MPEGTVSTDAAAEPLMLTAQPMVSTTTVEPGLTVIWTSRAACAKVCIAMLVPSSTTTARGVRAG